MATVTDRLCQSLYRYTPLDVKLAYQKVKSVERKYLAYGALVAKVEGVLKAELEEVAVPEKTAPPPSKKTFEQKVLECRSREGVTPEDELDFLKKLCPNSWQQKSLTKK